MNKKISPIIKWTGGKYREFAFFKNKIPSFERYFEPFFGGGGVFFNLQTNRPSFINDKSEDLMSFYRLISNPTFKRELYRYADAWQELTLFSQSLWEMLNNEFCNLQPRSDNKKLATNEIEDVLKSIIRPFTTLNCPKFIIESTRLHKKIVENIINKQKRIVQICTKENRIFNASEWYDHFETAIKSGFYLFCRDLMNQQKTNNQLSPEKAAANWYFVREFCYASMFRFNAKGEFNIPYGGIAYNKKKLAQKIDAIFAEETQHIFASSQLFNLDFEDFLSTVKPTSEDFIFVDPPYDSEFSEYDQNAFTAQDQIRLANFLLSCKAKWMVVIKETEFIKSIYNRNDIFISDFNKQYTYNVRGRNNRAVNHLIITNY